MLAASNNLTSTTPGTKAGQTHAMRALAATLERDDAAPPRRRRQPRRFSRDQAVDCYLGRLGRELRGEAGTTLPELLVVIVMIGILSLVGFAIVTAVFDATIQGTQYLNQQDTIQRTNGYLAQKLSHAEEGSLGLSRGGKQVVDPVSLAGDQFVFTQGERCYRVFYLGYTREIKVAISEDAMLGCADIAPKRGPNETVGAADDYQLENPSDPHYDWVLDDPIMGKPSSTANVFSLADGVVLNEIGTSLSGAPFTFIDSAQQGLDVDQNASSSSDNSLYEKPEVKDVAAVQMSMYALGSSDPHAKRGAKPLAGKFTYYLGQLPSG